MIHPSWFLLGLALPAAICAATVFATGWVFGKRGWVTAGLGWALGIAAGFASGYHAVDGWPPVPPTESQHWLVMVVLPVLVLAASFGPFPSTRLGARMIIRFFQFMLAAVIPPLLLQSALKYDWSGRQATVWLANLGCGIIILWLLLDQLKQRCPGRWVLILLTMIAGGTGVVLMMSGSQSLAQMGLSLAAVLAGGWAVSWIVPRATVTPATTGVVIVLLAGLWINGYYYASMTAVNTILLAVSPLAAWIGELPPVAKLQGWRSAAIRITAAAVPVVTAIVLAAMQFRDEISQPSYY